MFDQYTSGVHSRSEALMKLDSLKVKFEKRFWGGKILFNSVVNIIDII